MIQIKTIGDAYMAVAGLPVPRPDHAEATIRFACALLEAASRSAAATASISACGSASPQAR